MIRVNLMGLPKTRKRARAPIMPVGGGLALVLLVGVLVAVAGYQYFVRYQSFQQQIAQLNMDIATLEHEATDLARIRAEYDSLSKQKELYDKRNKVMTDLEAKRSGPVELLTTLASAVVSTDSLWLTGFTQTGQTVTIEGTALNVKAVADFITRLLNTRIFSDVDLKETAQDTADKEMEKFVFTVNGQLTAPAPTT